jgi:hypothetical protein
LLRSRFPVVLLAFPQVEEAEAPDESASPAPPTSPSFKNSLRVNAMQIPCFQASTRLDSCRVRSLGTIGTIRIRQVAYLRVRQVAYFWGCLAVTSELPGA